MTKSATNFPKTQVLIWLLWAISLIIFLIIPTKAPAARWQSCVGEKAPAADWPLLATAVDRCRRDRSAFPWSTKKRLRKWAWKRYQTLKRAHRRAVWTARVARLALAGALTMAEVVDWLTHSQLRRRLGALPVLYALLEVLEVREIINRHCPTQAEVDHGTVAIVLILNRLNAPRPLYRVAAWLAQTVLVYSLDVEAAKFNDDRLARTLDALSEHAQAIWQAVVHQAYVKAEIDLSVIFYDLSAFIAHGEYKDSDYLDFGFAHNTPMNKRKFKMGLNTTADGNLPVDYKLWPGCTADKATVQENMARLARLLKRHHWSVGETLMIGDRANLNDELALSYQDHNLSYLAGLQTQKKCHRQLLVSIPEKQFYSQLLTDEKGPQGYWGRLCTIQFKHEGRQTTHRGLVVLSGPMRTAIRRSRAANLHALRQELSDVKAKIGQPYYRSIKCVQRRANTRLKNSPVGKLMRAEAYLDEHDQVRLRWWVDRSALWRAMQSDGRYLLVTNDWNLSPQEMLALYRQKDGGEKCFTVAKSDLRVSPIYLHKDRRIEAMLLVNMLALLTYSLLERQAHKNGLQLTTRRIIEKLSALQVVETLCWDGSRLYRITPVDTEQAVLLTILAALLEELRQPPTPGPQLPDGGTLPLALPPPRRFHQLL